MLTGVFAARNIAGAAYDVWSVNVEKEYHEEGPESESVSERAVPQPVAPAAAEPPAALAAQQLVEEAFARLDPIGLGAGFGAAARGD